MREEYRIRGPTLRGDREGKEKGLKPKEFLGVIRYLLTGFFEGISVHDLLEMLDTEQITRRLKQF